MSLVLQRLLEIDLDLWDKKINFFEESSKELKVPMENNTITLHEFNLKLNDLYSEVVYWYYEARRNKDAIERLLETILKDYYKGQNELARKAAGIQLARGYPIHNIPFIPINHRCVYNEKVNLFDLEDIINGHYYKLAATIKSLQAKAEAKITNNSLIKLEQNLTPS